MLFQLLDKLHHLYSIYSQSKGSLEHIYSPINFERLLTNVKELYNLKGKNKSDVSPLDIVDAIEDMYNHCLVSGKRNTIGRAFYEKKLQQQ